MVTEMVAEAAGAEGSIGWGPGNWVSNKSGRLLMS